MLHFFSQNQTVKKKKKRQKQKEIRNMTGKRKHKGKYKCWKKRKPMEAWERCNMDRKRTPVRNFGY